MTRMTFHKLPLSALALGLLLADGLLFASDPPVCADSDVSVALFAEDPLIVTPIGIAVDERGQVFVAESHTHFRPDEYDGPEFDRIVILRDTDGDGRADKRTVFHEGFTHVMDIAFHPDGSLFVATRMNIHRMVDHDRDGTADTIRAVVRMETAGTYPHNGISGLCFNADSSLNFGLGENMGHDYTLIGTDGGRLRGGGEGGTTYRVKSDGSGLQRVTTGWWNPFGMCVDAQGRIFGTDNDPGESPPCRLIQIHLGADYGYEYRYGRSGRHPLVSWTGDLPGTIPMVQGTGEAPSGIIAIEGTNLPERYLGDLLVASWADHRVDRFAITQPHDSAQVTAGRSKFVSGGQDFRPIGLAVSPEGSIYVSDWVLSSYQLHQKGRIWKVSGAGPSRSSRVQPTASAETPHLIRVVEESEDIAYRVRAIHELLARKQADPAAWATKKYPAAVRGEAIHHLALEQHSELLLQASESPDPVLRHAAIESLSRQTATAAFARISDPPSVPVLLAMKRSEARAQYAASGALTAALSQPEEPVWEVAVKWIADDVLVSYRSKLAEELGRPSLTVKQFLMLAAAIDRLDQREPRDVPPNDLLAKTAVDESNSVALRAAALRLLGPDDQVLPTPILVEYATHRAAAIRVEAIRMLAFRVDKSATSALFDAARSAQRIESERVEAIDALGVRQEADRETLLTLANSSSANIATAALRSLKDLALSESERQQLKAISIQRPELSEAVTRAAGGILPRPVDTDIDGWMNLLTGSGDPVAGERVFFSSKVATCGKCHRHSGRGTAVGPSLSLIGRRLPKDPSAATRWLLGTILQPSKDMAPEYTPWLIVTTAGKQHVGLPRRKGGNREAYLGIDGSEFSIQKRDIEFHEESRVSIMSQGLLLGLTKEELRDLFAFLTASQ